MTVLSESVTLGQQGRVVIPAQWRHVLGLEPGATLSLRLDGRKITIETPADIVARLQSALAAIDPTRSMVDELISDRRQEAERELLDP